MIDTKVYYSGKPYPLGATWDGEGVNFALYAENAEAVELCLFDSLDDDQETMKIHIRERTNHVWHTYLPGLKPGDLYGYRVYGMHQPGEGHRFNHNKLLLDPYAKSIAGDLQWDDALFGYQIGDADEDLSFSRTDSAPYIPKSVVVSDEFDWEDDESPDIPYYQTVIYEAHVKGLTILHPGLPENLRGTYAGIAHPVMIDYLRELGITSLELMPVHHFIDDRHLKEKGLCNYWGYNTIGFFAPDSRYASSGFQGEQVKEFKEMVKALHKAGIEVILDVVYNHTAEGNQLGPTLSFRGIDNASYYRLCDDKRYYMDYTGTGNTLNSRMPYVLKLITDSLRYWIEEMHVDGFRFDLASALARELHEVDKLSAFFDIIHQDPVISRVKLIAEPWDVGEGGYQVGKFPAGWAEWNGLYRDCMRDFWRGADSKLAEFAERFSGSPDLYKNDYRNPGASINFLAAHDGFPLRDLVQYEQKHNEANLDENRDGENENRSCNYGVEGPTEDEGINELRARQQRNFLCTLFLSQGVPMLLSGDELGRTQGGNNNAYCQDNEISWIDWSNIDSDLLDFTRRLIQFRKDHPSFSRKSWFQGLPIRGVGVEDICWFRPDGNEMEEENWNVDCARSLGVFLSGLGLRSLGPKGEKLTDKNFYVVFNAHHDPINIVLPPAKYGHEWKMVFDTANNFERDTCFPRDALAITGRSILLFEADAPDRKSQPPHSLPELTIS